MDILPIFIILALLTGAAGLYAFFWSVKHGQFDDMDGASARLFHGPDETHNASEEEKLKQSQTIHQADSQDPED